MYVEYLKYIIEHKKNVGIECIRMAMFTHAITHDLSKFLPSEFIPYAKFFYPKLKTDRKTSEEEQNFQKGWNHHQKRNKHHWNYWVSVKVNKNTPVEMPIKCVKQMVADWNGMSRKFGGSTAEYFRKNEHKMLLHPTTRERIAVAIREYGRTHHR